MKQKFPDKIIGYSDHTLPNDMKTLEVAALIGAQIIEKHFTHDKNLPGNDHYHAMDKDDLKNLINIINRDQELLGDINNMSLYSQKLARKNARRSLVSGRFLKKGTIIKAEDLTWKRPAFGISPKYINNVIGKETKEDIQPDTIITWSLMN